ncbi:MAG TPA: hypothetical protein DCQ92_12530 [Verrucomicrobia subdivision 3 bacterium]|nr:hypothetical protein [Limisphaerales bacterium]
MFYGKRHPLPCNVMFIQITGTTIITSIFAPAAPVPTRKTTNPMKSRLVKNQLIPLRATLALAVVLGACLAPNFAQAASATWNVAPTSNLWEAGAGDNNWSTGVGLWPGGTSTSSGDTATFNVASSITTLQIASNWNIKNVTFDTADCSAYTINITGGTARLTSGGVIQLTSTVTQPQAFTGNQIRLHTSAGTTLQNNSATPTATLSFSGGFKANNSSGATTDLQPVNLAGSNTGSNVVGGAIVDYSGQPLGSPGYAASVNKSGTGTWYLTANNTYTGPTTVSGGLLALTGSGSISRSSSITITGGTLEWDNPFSTASVAVGPGALIIGSSATITSLSLADTAALTLPAGASAPTAAGTLTVGGTTTLTVSSLPGFTSYSAAQFPVISYVAQSGLSDSSFVLGALPSTYTGYISNNTANSSIDIVVTNGPTLPNSITWNGNVDGDWDTAKLNWLLGASAATYVQGSYATFPGDFVTFDDSATGQTNINLTTVITPGSLTVSNTAGTPTAHYAFIGAGGISGSTGLTKEGSGDLTIANSGANDFSGDIVLDAGSLTLDQTSNVTLANVISGSAGTLIKANTNILTLSGGNSYAGDTVIANGTIQVANFSALGALNSGTVTIAAGSSLDLTSISSANVAGGFGAKQFNVAGSGPDGNGAIINNSGLNQQNAFQNITLTADATVGGGSRWDMRGGSPGPNLDLAGHTLTKTGTNQMSMVSVIVTDGNIDINNGVLSFETGAAVNGTGTITVNAGGALGMYRSWQGSITRPIVLNGGSLKDLNGTPGATNDSPITLTADSILDCNSNATSITHINGVISEQGGSFGLTKTNANAYWLSAANTYSGDTTIAQGTLALVDGGSMANSANIKIAAGATLNVSGRSDGTLALASGQTLGGKGTVVGTTAVGSGATVAPGASVGQLTDTGSVLLQSGGTYSVEVQDATSGAGVGNDSLAVSGNIGVQASSGNHFTIKLVSLDGTGAAGNAANFDNTTNYTWTIATGTVTNFNASAFTVDTSGFSNPLGGGQFFVGSTGNSLVVLFKSAVSVGGAGGSISNPTVDGSGHPALSGHGIPGYIYGVESSTTGVTGPWVNAGPDEASSTVTTSGDGTWSFTDANQTNPPLIFYRLYYPYSVTPPQ